MGVYAIIAKLAVARALEMPAHIVPNDIALLVRVRLAGLSLSVLVSALSLLQLWWNVERELGVAIVHAVDAIGRGTLITTAVVVPARHACDTCYDGLVRKDPREDASWTCVRLLCEECLSFAEKWLCLLAWFCIHAITRAEWLGPTTR